MHIRVKKITADRYMYLETVYPVEGVIYLAEDLIPLREITNASSMFEFMRVNYALDKACIKKIADNEYEIDFNIALIKNMKKKQLTEYMKRYINKYFSPLQQSRYFMFFTLHEKGSRTTAEQYIYDIELHGRTESVAWNEVKTVLQWFYDCINIYNGYIDTINNENDVKILAGMTVRNVSFPAYTGG